jgi:hypothetical protein
VVSFFDDNETWLQQVPEEGRGDGSLQFSGSTRDVARMIISCLKGRCSSPAPVTSAIPGRRGKPRRGPRLTESHPALSGQPGRALNTQNRVDM